MRGVLLRAAHTFCVTALVAVAACGSDDRPASPADAGSLDGQLPEAALPIEAAADASGAGEDSGLRTSFGEVSLESVRSTDDIDDEFPWAVALGADGLYLGGSFDQVIDLGGGALTGSGPSKAFIAGLAMDGAVRWQHAFGDEEWVDTVRAISLAGETHVQVAGTAIGSATFGGEPHTSSSRGVPFGFITSLARVDGSWQWDVIWDRATPVTMAAIDGGRVAIGATGAVPGEPALQSAFVSLLDAATGSELWQRPIVTADGADTRAAILHVGQSADHLLVVGSCSEPAMFAERDAPCPGMFFAGLDLAGALQFMHPAPASVVAAASAADGMYVVVAHDGADLGSGSIPGRFAVGLVLPDGTVPWWRGLEAASSTKIEVAVASAHGIYLFGDSGGHIDFGIGNLPQDHLFAAALSPTGELRWLRAWERDPARNSPFLAAATHDGRIAFTIATDAWIDLGEGRIGPMAVNRLTDAVWAVLHE